MGRKLEDKMDVVDALEDIKAQVAFLGHVNNILLETEYRPNSESEPGQEIICGMSVVFGSLRDQVSDVSEALQKNLYEVREVVTATVNRDDGKC
ncbi:MAG: hypothetical protein Q8K00_13165 [Syntrophales bacterium]|nr:hypothetical protein [Syntrophales bacterium]